MELAAVAMGISAVSSVLGGVSALQAGRQSAYNAEAEGRQAQLTAAAEATRQRRINEAQHGAFRAAVGASGSTFEGSPMMAYLENVKQGELNAQDHLYAGQLKRRSYNMQADLYRREGKNALYSGVLGGAGIAAKYFGGGKL